MCYQQFRLILQFGINDIEDLGQDCGISIASALEIPQSFPARQYLDSLKRHSIRAFLCCALLILISPDHTRTSAAAVSPSYLNEYIDSCIYLLKKNVCGVYFSVHLHV